MTRGLQTLAAAAAVLAAAGCGGTTSGYTHHRGVPTEIEARDAYFNTPLVSDDAVREMKLGTTYAAVVRLFQGASAVQYTRAGRRCVIYPIIGTEAWDRFGSPIASEWELCFSRDRLAGKRRYAAAP